MLCSSIANMAKRDQKTYVSYYGVEGARKVEMALVFFIKPLVGTNHHGPAVG